MEIIFVYKWLHVDVAAAAVPIVAAIDVPAVVIVVDVAAAVVVVEVVIVADNDDDDAAAWQKTFIHFFGGKKSAPVWLNGNRRKNAVSEVSGLTPSPGPVLQSLLTCKYNLWAVVVV